jgi:phage shock protein E
MRNPTLLLVGALSFLLGSCGSQQETTEETVGAESGPIHLDAPKAAEILATDPEITVIDIRTPEEFAEGHIEGALNIDFTGDDFEAELAKLDEEKPYLMHCASGNRSGQALPTFEKLHFHRLYHLSTGFRGWVADGQPVEK